MNLDAYKIPADRKCMALSVRKISGGIFEPEHILSGDDTAVTLEYTEDARQGGKTPVLILDMGPASPGGYPVFHVKSAKGDAVLRISYSDFWLPMTDHADGAKGDFIRGCCKYLGVELPVLPANPGRYELYTVRGGNEYTAPLVQGQQRFVRITLENPGSRVELKWFYIHYTSDLSPVDGGFSCDDERLCKLWHASVYTFQLASLTHPAWDTLGGWLLLRALTKGNDAGILRGFSHRDYVISFTARISLNPYAVSGIGVMFRAQDQNNGYVVRFDLDGTLTVLARENGVYRELKPRAALEPLTDNTDYRIQVRVEGESFVTSLNGKVVDETRDSTFGRGSVGFCQTPEKWAMARDLAVDDPDGTPLFRDDFTRGLDHYLFTVTPPFVADGAKRDRLPWSGDLDWAGRNNYYSMRSHIYMKGALEILAFHQTAEGFVYGTCYPENTVKPENRSYGYYESDIFSAWFIPVAADYFLYTGDRASMAGFYETAKRDAEYLWRYVEGDGIFNQRYETSKGLWDHELGDYGRNGYNNIIVYDAFCESAFIAEHLGYEADRSRFESMAAKMKEGITARLCDEREGWIVKSADKRKFCYMSNSYALSIGFFTPESARVVMDRLMAATPEHGKVLSTNIRGAYRYGMEKEAFTQLTKRHALHFDWGFDTNISWFDMLEDDDVPHTTYECMMHPRAYDPAGTNWGDMSHPDTGMAHILSGCILGVEPLTPGYRQFIIKPQTYGLKRVSGRVPVPGGGTIHVSVTDEGGRYAAEVGLESCEGLRGVLSLPVRGGGQALRDGAPVNGALSENRLVIDLEQYGPGLYEVR